MEEPELRTLISSVTKELGLVFKTAQSSVRKDSYSYIFLKVKLQLFISLQSGWKSQACIEAIRLCQLCQEVRLGLKWRWFSKKKCGGIE